MIINAEKGSGLIVVIMVVAFLLTIGIAVLTVTSTGSQVAGNVRSQEEAFNAAEAGFEAARNYMEDLFSNGTWTSFDGHYVNTPSGDPPAAIELPNNDNYFRKKTDEELLGMLSAATTNIIFYNQQFVGNSYYTAFLVDDEAGGGATDPADTILVCIGARKVGTKILATSRLEIVFAFETGAGGTNP